MLVVHNVSLRMLLTLLTVAFMTHGEVAFAKQEQDVEIRAGRISFQEDEDSWTQQQEFVVVRGFAGRPTQETLDLVSVDWAPLKSAGRGRSVTVHGTLRVPIEGGQNTRPVDWFQGITVCVVGYPDGEADWSKGIGGDFTIWESGLVNRDGTFELRLDLREADHNPLQAQAFQFGLALAEHSKTADGGWHVEWNSKHPATTSSVYMRETPDLSYIAWEVQLLDPASEWPFDDYDTTKFIRAANALRTLGKEEALAKLEEYTRLTSGLWRPGEQDIIFWIIRGIFEPIQLGEQIPEPLVGIYTMDYHSRKNVAWPIRPMATARDIPFMVGRTIPGRSGIPDHPSSHIHWARLHGVLRDEPITPSANPVLAAEEIFNSPRFELLQDYELGNARASARRQAVAMLQGVVEDLPPLGFYDSLADEQWQELLERTSKMDIRWDAEQQKFVLHE